MRVYWRTSTETVYAHTKALTVAELYDIQSLIFIYKYGHVMLPKNFSGVFNVCFDVTCRDTRSSDFYYVQTRLTTTKRSFICNAPLLWNRLDLEIQESNPLGIFKRKFKNKIKLSKLKVATET